MSFVVSFLLLNSAVPHFGNVARKAQFVKPAPFSTTLPVSDCRYTHLMSTNAVFADISADEFHALEEKVYRTIEMLKTAREERSRAEREASRLRSEMSARDEELASTRSELSRLRRERDEVRTRVEKIMKQIDALVAEESALQ